MNSCRNSFNAVLIVPNLNRNKLTTSCMFYVPLEVFIFSVVSNCKKKVNGPQNPMKICIKQFKLILSAFSFGLKPLNMKNQLLRVTRADR